MNDDLISRAEAFDSVEIMAIKALEVEGWIPCKPSELPKDKELLVTHNAFGHRYVTMLFWDMTGWSDNVSDVVAYMPKPEPYREDEYEQ